MTAAILCEKVQISTGRSDGPIGGERDETLHAPGRLFPVPHIVCRELGIDVDIVEVDRATHRTRDGEDYLAVNGNGYVPALRLDGGEVLTEGPAIVQYLADSVPGGVRLLPETGSLGRSRVQSWLNFITAELHKPMALLFGAVYAPAHDGIRDLVRKRLGWAEERLVGPYLTGEDFTVADAYLFVCLNWSPWIGLDLAQWPRLQAFMAAVAARPGVQAALGEEDLRPFDAGGTFFAPQAFVAGRSSSGVRP